DLLLDDRARGDRERVRHNAESFAGDVARTARGLLAQRARPRLVVLLRLAGLRGEMRLLLAAREKGACRVLELAELAQDGLRDPGSVDPQIVQACEEIGRADRRLLGERRRVETSERAWRLDLRRR